MLKLYCINPQSFETGFRNLTTILVENFMGLMIAVKLIIS